MERIPEKSGANGAGGSLAPRVDAAGAGNTAPAYRFAGFCLSTRRQCLYSDGEEIPLSTKLYHLLLAFLQRPDSVLTKEDITQAAWPGQVVTDAAIAKQVQRLRQLLDDTGRDAPLIETHRGMGYRLTCSVTPEYKPQDTGQGKPGGGTPWPPIAVAALLLIAVLTWLALDLRGNSSSSDIPKPPALAVQPVAGEATALTEGAAEYLAARLGPAADIAPIIALEERPVTGTDLGSLRLSKARPGPVAALHLTRDGDTYKLQVSLRQGEQANRQSFQDQSAAAVLERGTQWLRAEVGGVADAPPLSPDTYALASYFEGLAATGPGHTCERAMEYYRAAIARDPGFHHARLRLARCERTLGRPHEAAALAAALLADTEKVDHTLLLDARLVAARAHHDLGNTAEASRYLEEAQLDSTREAAPLARLKTLSALALLARLENDPPLAETLALEHLKLAETHYPLPAYLAKVHLELADGYHSTGRHDALLRHARKARSLAEETGDLETLMESYRYLAGSYFRNGDTDAAVQLALAARPIIDQTRAAATKAYFLQFSALALNLRGLFEPAREYTSALRELGETSANPMYGAIADFTVMHRLYVQRAFAEARALAGSTRSRLEAGTGAHAAIPMALAFEAIAASRGAPLEEAEALVNLLERRYPDNAQVRAQILRARGHIAAQRNKVSEGIELLREAEAYYRDTGMHGIANYVGYEITELRLASEPKPPWDDIKRLSAMADFNYQLTRLEALAHAAEGNYLGATTVLEEARLRGNDLWSEQDQLLLEDYRSLLAMADNGGAEEHVREEIP